MEVEDDSTGLGREAGSSLSSTTKSTTSAFVPISEVIDFCFPTAGLWHPKSAARLLLVAQYGPLREGKLWGGPYSARRALGDTELRLLVNENCKTADGYEIHDYTREELEALLSILSSDSEGRVKFIDLQNLIFTDHTRLVANARKQYTSLVSDPSRSNVIAARLAAAANKGKKKKAWNNFTMHTAAPLSKPMKRGGTAPPTD